MSEAAPIARSAPLSAAQHKAALWADDQQQVYAVVMGSRVPDLAVRLASADVRDHDCLLPGALEPEQRLTAPYLVHLKRDSAFTDWLLFEAPESFAEWGVLVSSAAPMTALRNYLRGHLQARLPSGQTIALDWMDPEILVALLAHAEPPMLRELFGPAISLTIAGRGQWRHATLALGSLQQHEAPLARAA